MEKVDLLIIGGGVNGCGIARDAAGRGYTVLLAEQADLASGTSSGATKLIHGGLRYLEHYAFRLVRDSLRERETLWKIAPHIIWPMRFVLPVDPAGRPAWLLRLGLAIYDHIGGRKLLPPTRSLTLSQDPIASVLDERFTRAFEYSDCWVDDARLVVLNARDAADRGAEIAVRTRVTAVRPQEDGWLADLEDQAVGKPYSVEARKVGTRHVRARMIVNAAGPWADIVARSAFGNNATSRIRLVRGSHIVLRYRLPDERAFIFQNADGRVMFAIPYEGTFTLVGTTDAETEADPSQATPSGEEIDYLLAGISENLRTTFTRADVAWQFAAVRPLLDSGEAGDAQDATRDYTLSLEHPRGAPLMTVLGGKLTTYRRLAEAALEKIEAELGPVDTRSAGWTGKVQLPGGDFPRGGADALAQRLRADFPFLAAATCERLVRSYGTRAWDMLGAATSCEDLGTHFGAGLTAREIEFLQRTEFAQTAEDILWRRTKCGLHMTAQERDRVADHLGEVAAPPTAAGG